MDSVDEERKIGKNNDRYKFAFVFTAATLAVCCTMLILLLANRNAKSKISVINYDTVTVSADENADLTTAEPDSDIPDGRIDLNSCTSEQLCSIPGIGEKTAQKILDYRDSAGGFSSVDELINVKGIGEVRLAKIRQYVTVEN